MDWTLALIKYRYRVVVWVSSTAAPPNGVLLPPFGVLPTEVPPSTLALRSQPSSKLDVISAGAGSKVLTILREWSPHFRAYIKANATASVDWEEVACPAAITAKSGCKRIGDTGAPISVEAYTPYAASVTRAPVPTPTAASTPVVQAPKQSSSSAAPAHTSTSSSPLPVEAHESTSTTHMYTSPTASSPATYSHSSTATTFLTRTSPASSVEAPAPTETDDYDTCEL